MQLNGKQELNATASVIWKILLDPESLARVLPGVKSLERSGENLFRSVFKISIGPVSGSFAGTLMMEDMVEEQSALIKMQQDSSIGKVRAEVKLELLPIDDRRTELKFDGHAKISGMLASIGQRIIQTVASTLTKEFFVNMEKELADSKTVK